MSSNRSGQPVYKRSTVLSIPSIKAGKRIPSVRTQLSATRNLSPSLCGLRKITPLADVAAHLPDVARVRLLYVNRIERHLGAVLIEQLVERGNLPAKWRSSVAPEDQRHGPDAAKPRK